MSRLLTKSWIDSYAEYISATEIPHSYNIWSAISAIGSSLSGEFLYGETIFNFFRINILYL